MRKAVRKAIESSHLGTMVATCKDGQDLANQIGSLKPELILLDLKMPNMDGPAVVQRLRNNPKTAKIPVIFLTGVERIKMSDDYNKIGVIGIVHKSTAVAAMPGAIEEIWNSYKS